MVVLYYLIIFALIGCLIGTYYYLKKKNKDTTRFYKVLLYLLIAVFFFRFMWKEDVMQFTFRLENTADESITPVISLFGLILNWLMYSAVLTITIFGLSKIKSANTLIKFFAMPVVMLCIIGFVPMAITLDGYGVLGSFDLRILIMSVEFGLSFSLCFIAFANSNYFKVEKVDLKILLYIPLLILACIPPYMLQGLFGYVKYAIKLKDFTLPHRIIIYLSLLIPIALYFLLRKKGHEFKKAILLFISIGTLMSFSVNYKFPDFLDITHWPFHLCNTAMYIIVLCLLFSWKKLFYFTYFINVLGALLAMLMPNYSSSANLFSESIVVFYIDHYIAFFMPILIVALGIYARPKLREFRWSMIGFGIYFALVLVLNAWFSNYGSVDYFFVNSDFIAEKLGRWAERTRDYVWSFNIGSLSFTFYPLYQFLFFIIYVIMGAGVWFVYEGAYSFVDTLYDISDRKQKIKLDKLALEVSLNGRGKEEPMSVENANKLVLKNFSKRYGKSDVYAVKDANLEINGGEIFGFLGHNGAGKSTIIKSIVGIQPITSGSIEVCGYDVDKQSVMAKKNIGFVPDHYALYEKLTGREYINYIADLYDVSKEDRDKAINKYVELFELGEAFDNQIKTYSHGMKQKIAIMSALVHNPKVWILDEPLTGLDPNSIYQVKVCMKQHAKAGNIVFFSSHLIDIVEQLCDRIAIIKKGKILVCEKVSDIEKNGSLENYYLEVNSTRVKPTAVSDDEKEKSKEIVNKSLDTRAKSKNKLKKNK